MFTVLQPPVNGNKTNPHAIRVSVVRSRKKVSTSPLRLCISIGVALFETIGAPDFMSVAVGGSDDRGKLQIAPAPARFKCTRLKNSALVRAIVPGLHTVAKGVEVQPTNVKNVLTFALPREFLISAEATLAEQAAAQEITRSSRRVGGGSEPPSLNAHSK